MLQDWNNWSPLAFEEMDSALNIQQYIQQTIKANPADVATILTPPLGKKAETLFKN